MEFATTFIILAVVFGFIMAWGIGANDVANAMGTSVGSKALTIKQAIIIAIIFEVAGALLAGGEVTQTIRSDIIDPDMFINAPELMVYGMLASLLAAGMWLLIATHYGWPVSTTHSIIGAIVGFGWIALGVDAIAWGEITDIVLSWILTPVLSGVIAYIVFMSIQQKILNRSDPVHQARKLLPFYVFFMALVIVAVTLNKGLKHIGLPLDFTESLFLSILFALAIALLTAWLMRRVRLKAVVRGMEYHNVERLFGLLMIFTACATAFAHGSNDVANAIGPVAAVIAIVQTGGQVAAKSLVPFWILALGAGGIMTGLVMYGYRVMRTIGEHITDLTPSRGFAANLATASTVVLASGFGLPISTTQTLVGAVLGVGLARGIAALNLRVVRNIFMSWIITLPAGAILAILFFYVLKFAFSLAS